MKRVLILLLVPIFCSLHLHAQTAGDMVTGFRYAIDETDTASSVVTNTAVLYFLNKAQYRYSLTHDAIEKSTRIIYSDDSADYGLPGDFVMAKGVVVNRANYWEPALPNPFFLRDTNVTNWYVAFDSVHEARLYIRTKLGAGDTIRVTYRALAEKLDSLADTSDVPVELQGEIVDEAILMYLTAKANYSAEQALWQQRRIDEGIIKPEGQ